MRKTIHSYQKLQVKIPFTIVADSIDSAPISGTVRDTLRKWIRLIRICGGECDWSVRRIAAHFEMSEGKFQSHKRALVLAGWLIVTERRIQGCRLSETNLYRLGGEGVKKLPQVLKQDLNTNTTTPREVAQPVSYARLRWEHHRKHNHPPALRRMYDLNGRLQAENRHLRRFRHHGGAAVGGYSPVSSAEMDESMREWRSSLSAEEAVRLAAWEANERRLAQ